jgi:ribonuclease HI
VKLNVDGLFVSSDGTSGAGMILRYDKGGIVFSACQSLWACADALNLELAAALEGPTLAFQWSALPVVVESDSL